MGIHRPGRVAQLAVVGNLVGDLFHLPGQLSISSNLKFSDVPSGLQALQVVPVFGWIQILAFAGFLEVGPFKQEANRGPGDIAKFSWWTRYTDPVADKSLQLQEIKNGRLAMIAIAGQITHELLTGKTPIGLLTAGTPPNPFHL